MYVDKWAHSCLTAPGACDRSSPAAVQPERLGRRCLRYKGRSAFILDCACHLCTTVTIPSALKHCAASAAKLHARQDIDHGFVCCRSVRNAAIAMLTALARKLPGSQNSIKEAL